MIDRLSARACELCGASDVTLQMHHIRKISDLKERPKKKAWEIKMITRARKTMAVCIPCHKNIHHQR